MTGPEKPDAAHGARPFAANDCPPTTVYAAPVFVPVTMDTNSLPLQKLYDHPDFVDLISAREFGLEQTTHDRLPLCVALLAAMQERVLPLPAALAALTTWCTGYGCTLYEEAAS